MQVKLFHYEDLTTEEVVQYWNWKQIICSHLETGSSNSSPNDIVACPEGPKQQTFIKKRHLGPFWLVTGHLFSGLINSDIYIYIIKQTCVIDLESIILFINKEKDKST